MKNDDRPIGMFDSGVGGLTVYKEIKDKMPNQKIIYVGDTKRFPYGSKNKETIIEASKECVDFLLGKDVKEIIIACGTATSQALDVVKNIYKVPINGIIEPTVDFIKEKGYKNVGVIATRGTIESMAWENHLKKKIKDINVYNQACPLLASMAEEGWTNNEIARLTLMEYLKGFKNIDALILGCTHYPLFEELIRKIMPEVEILNTGKIIANNLEEKYQVTGKKEEIKKIEQDEFYLTDTQCNFLDVAQKILNRDMNIKEI